MVARLSQRLKSTLFENFSNGAAPNSVLFRENETKIVKIIHSALCMYVVVHTYIEHKKRGETQPVLVSII